MYHVTDIDHVDDSGIILHNEPRSTVHVNRRTDQLFTCSQFDANPTTDRGERRPMLRMQVIIAGRQPLVDLPQHVLQQHEWREIDVRRCRITQTHRTFRCPRNIHADSDNDESLAWCTHGQKPAEFEITDYQIIRPLEMWSNAGHCPTRRTTRQGHHASKAKDVFTVVAKKH